MFLEVIYNWLLQHTKQLFNINFSEGNKIINCYNSFSLWLIMTLNQCPIVFDTYALKIKMRKQIYICNCGHDEFIGFLTAGSLVYSQSISANMQRVTWILHSAINLTNVLQPVLKQAIKLKKVLNRYSRDSILIFFMKCAYWLST